MLSFYDRMYLIKISHHTPLRHHLTQCIIATKAPSTTDKLTGSDHVLQFIDVRLRISEVVGIRDITSSITTDLFDLLFFAIVTLKS